MQAGKKQDIHQSFTKPHRKRFCVYVYKTAAQKPYILKLYALPELPELM
jgi:hypothetical protein